LTIHPDLPSQDQSLGLLARFGQAALDQFDIQAAGFHVANTLRSSFRDDERK
jgi:hypothetical protein